MSGPDFSRAALPDQEWHSLEWSVTLPAQTSFEVFVRASDNRLTLSNKHFVQAAHGVVLSEVHGRYLEVRASLRRENPSPDPYLDWLTIYRLSPE